MKCFVIFVMVGKRTYVKGSCGIDIGLRMYSFGNLSFKFCGLCDFGILRLWVHAFFYKKHNYKKHRPISAKTLRNIQGYSRKPKKHFIEEIMVKRLEITFPRYLHWRNINLFCSYSHCVSIQFLKAISKRFYLTLRLCNMLAKKHLRNILTQKLAKPQEKWRPRRVENVSYKKSVYLGLWAINLVHSRVPNLFFGQTSTRSWCSSENLKMRGKRYQT